MWKVVKLNMETGESEEIAAFGTSAEAEAHFSSLDDQNNVVVVYDGPVSKNRDESHGIAEEILRINKDRVSRVAIGMKLGDVKYAPSFVCPTRCFCVIAHGRRRCEGPYETPFGTIWVDCGVSC